MLNSYFRLLYIIVVGDCNWLIYWGRAVDPSVLLGVVSPSNHRLPSDLHFVSRPSVCPDGFTLKGKRLLERRVKERMVTVRLR
jgi:hypothetical protein